jgi:hypothetical protein
MSQSAVTEQKRPEVAALTNPKAALDRLMAVVRAIEALAVLDKGSISKVLGVELREVSSARGHRYEAGASALFAHVQLVQLTDGALQLSLNLREGLGITLNDLHASNAIVPGVTQVKNILPNKGKEGSVIYASKTQVAGAGAASSFEQETLFELSGVSYQLIAVSIHRTVR